MRRFIYKYLNLDRENRRFLLEIRTGNFQKNTSGYCSNTGAVVGTASTGGKVVYTNYPKNWITVGRTYQTFYFYTKKSVTNFTYIKVYYTYDGFPMRNLKGSLLI